MAHGLLAIHCGLVALVSWDVRLVDRGLGTPVALWDCGLRYLDSFGIE